jgi:hypothetical protein
LVAPSQGLISIAAVREMRYGKRATQDTKENCMSASLESILETIKKLPPNEQRQLARKLNERRSMTEEEKARACGLVREWAGSAQGLDIDTIIHFAEDERYRGQGKEFHHEEHQEHEEKASFAFRVSRELPSTVYRLLFEFFVFFVSSWFYFLEDYSKGKRSYV